MKARCVVESMRIKTETVGARYIGDDENYYERYLEVGFRPIEHENKQGKTGEIPELDLSYTEDFSEGGGSSEYRESDSDIIKAVKRRYDIGDIVNVEFRRESACGNAINLGGIPMYIEHTKVTGVKLEKTFFECLHSEMRRIAKIKGILEQVNDTWIHSTEVWNLAREIGLCALKNNQEVNIYFLKKAAYSHDLGRMYTGSPASKKLEPAPIHGLRGREHFEKIFQDNQRLIELINMKEAEKLARICERHMGGSGFVKETYDSLREAENLTGLPEEDTLAETIEEKIVGYSDWRVHPISCNEGFLPRRVSDKEALARSWSLCKNQRQKDETLNLIKDISKITNNQYGHNNPETLIT